MYHKSQFLDLTFSMADSANFDQFYRTQLPRIYNFFLYRFGDMVLAEDLSSMTFEKAWKNRSRYRHELSALETWLFTIAHRVAIDHYRKSRNHVQIDEMESLRDGESLEETVQRRNDLEMMNVLLSQLPERERELVALKYGADLTNRDIAKLTGLSESNVAVILHRTLQVLREAWKVEYEG